MKKYFRLVFVFLFLLFTNTFAQNFAKSHIHANHVCDGSVPNNCFGYAQARAMGKTVGDAVCDPQASYADGIDLTKFNFTNDPNLLGIQIGDIVILNANNKAAGHAAVVSHVPSYPFNINNILVDQVPNSNGSEQLNVNLGSQIAIYGDPIGFCPTGYWKRVSVVLLNDFDSGILEVDKTTIRTYPHGGQLLPKPVAPPDPNPFISVGNGCWALFAPTMGTTINTLVRATDNQSADGFGRKFVRWEKDYGNPYGTELLLEEDESGSCTYTAKFARVFEITCQNDFAGTGGGIIKVEGINRDGIWVEPITENIISHNGQITLQAINNQYIGGYYYTFDHWSNGSTINPKTFTVTNHQTITAVFKERLNVNISGPTDLPYNQQGTFTATASGGSGTYTNYRWWERNDGDLILKNVKNGGITPLAPPTGYWIEQYGWEGQTSVQLARAYSFSLKCEVTDSDNNTATDIHSVTVLGGFLAKAQSEADEVSMVAIPEKVELTGNYPNPFNPNTTIRFGLPDADKVLLQVFNVNGQLIATLVDGYLEPGYHDVNFNGQRLSSGIYLYKLSTADFTAIKRMLIIK